MSLLFLALASPAAACGGFFCAGGPTPPVVQQAERIAFAIDLDEGIVEAHVQIFFEGDPIDFAWVVPVHGEPEVLLGDNALFDVLAQATVPTWQANTTTEGRCSPRRISSGCGGVELYSDFNPGGLPDVEVISESDVGPFEQVTLQASSADQLATWLDEHDFDLPENFEAVLAPYVAEQAYFVALKLQSDVATGDIEPIVLRYPGTEASIPIQLTSIASVDDLPVEVYVFGQHRAVPSNYMHVTVNPAVVDFSTGGDNYYEKRALAIDAAGGHAFVTEFAGDPSSMLNNLNEMIEDGSVAAETVDARQRARSLLYYPWLTRLDTSLSPSEMTIDPMFALAPDLTEPVSNVHQVDVLRDCRGRRWASDAYFEVQHPFGDQLLPGTGSVSPASHIDETIDIYAWTIEQFDGSGQAEPLVDNTDAIADQLGIANDIAIDIIKSGPGPSPTGSCSTGSRGAGFAGLGLAALMLLRRRRE